LTEIDEQICCAYAYRVKHNLTDQAFHDLPGLFRNQEDAPPKLSACQTRVTFLSGFKPEFYDCCPNSCVCYVAWNADLSECPHCREPRFRADGTPRQKFMYLPIIPRLVQFAASKEMASSMRERANRSSSPDEISDIFDGTHYKNLCKENIRVRGQDVLPLRKYFSDLRDIALGLSTDGFCPHKRRK
ncbi:hypothetical protein CYLTODRAFT_315278, partial [Cylindrobasidium torrendii FP15055 ss-10]